MINSEIIQRAIELLAVGRMIVQYATSESGGMCACGMCAYRKQLLQWRRHVTRFLDQLEASGAQIGGDKQ